MDRAERRRNERAQQKALKRKIPAVIVGDNIVAGELAGHQFEARRGELPEKVPGRHRWIATAVYSLPQEMAEAVDDESRIKLLDHENMVDLAIGCWDCEQALGAEIAADSPCPAPGDDR